MKRGDYLRHVASAALFVVLIVLAIGSMDSGGGGSRSTARQSNPAPVPALEPGSQWTYVQNEDAMGNGQVYSASVRSTNTVNFDFPYSGAQHATLTLRTHPRHGKDVILSIERGQFHCRSYDDDCSVLVRFDDGQAKTFSSAGPSDNSTEILFIRDYSRFAQGMLRAQQVRISAEVYQEGSPVFEFDVRGFNTSRYRPTR